MPALFPITIAPEDFYVGQPVRWMHSTRHISPYIGKVVAIHPNIYKVDVNFPIGGVRRMSPEDLIPVSPYADSFANLNENRETNNYYTYDRVKGDASLNDVTGLSGVMRSASLKNRESKLNCLNDAINWYNFRISKQVSEEKLLRKYAFKLGEGFIRNILSDFYQMPNKVASVSALSQIMADAIGEKDEQRKKAKIRDCFTIAFNTTGSNVFVKIDDLLDDASTAKDENEFTNLLMRAIGRGGGDLSKFSKGDQKDTDRF